MVIHMVSIGEETGNIEQMLENVAGYYEDDVQAATESMMALMEPFIIIVMAGIVGFLVIAMLSPMFSYHRYTMRENKQTLKQYLYIGEYKENNP